MARTANFVALKEKLLDVQSRYEACLKKAEYIEIEVLRRSAGKLSNAEYDKFSRLLKHHKSESIKLRKLLNKLQTKFEKSHELPPRRKVTVNTRGRHVGNNWYPV
jgi:hypothetical protein